MSNTPLLELDTLAIGAFEHLLDTPSPPRAPNAELRLLLALQTEVETTAILIAASASIANAAVEDPFASNAPKPSPASLRTYAPPDLSLFAAHAGQLIGGSSDAMLLAALQDLAARIALAKQMSRAYAMEAERDGDAPSVDAEALSDAWRHCCRSANRTLAALRNAIERQGAQNRPAAEARALLEAGQRGFSPCVDPDGCVTVPGWAERRRHTREVIELEAEVTLGLRTEPVRVLDLSPGGMGLTGLTNSRCGDAVAITLGDGRRLRGTVVWITGERAGVRFDTPLERDDPLLCA